MYGQIDSSKHEKLKFTGDYRFRIEHDWNAQDSEGVSRNDRSRLRYRFRFGLAYPIDKNSSFGGRIRSGNINDQQGPHVTIGGNEGEFGLVRIGLEKLYYQYKTNNLTAWVGKNSIPLKKNNELFWNDNVFPEGMGLSYQLRFKKLKSFNSLLMNTGHFIIRSNNRTFNEDSYLQVYQLVFHLLQGRLNLFPAFYYFNQVGNYPDKKQTFNLDYSIVHLGSEITIHKPLQLKLGIELYKNFHSYANVDSISTDLKDQTNGFVLSLMHGQTKEKGDWLFSISYAHLQKFAIVDYFAQNDWSRWDYSSIGASGSRISNFQGVELKLGYAIQDHFNLILRSYFVEQLVKLGHFREYGNRIRLDLNIGF